MRPQIDFITLSSYRTGTESSGTVEITRDVTDAVEGRTILLIDDILESGRTVAFARYRLLGRGAADVKLCVLLDKRGKRANVRPKSWPISSGSSASIGSSWVTA